jgi:hypothetical protein
MRRPIFRKGSFANVTSVAALVIAMSGTSAYAATLITSKQIKNGTIKGVDIHAATITADKLAAGTIPTVPAPYGGSYAYSTFHDPLVDVTGSPTTVLTLAVPTAGSYIANGVTVINNSGPTEARVQCSLVAESDNDVKSVFVEKLAFDSPNRTGYSLQVVHNFSGPGTVQIVCQALSGTVISAGNSKITAIKVDHLSNVAG